MNNFRDDFPLLTRRYHDQALIYFDNAATAPKPAVVINAVNDFYSQHNANVHRGQNFLAQEATDLYENARHEVAKFIGADPKEIIFTAGTTMSLNLVARTWGLANLQRGDVIAVTGAEHHSNLLPWMALRDELGLTLQYLEINDDGTWNEASLQALWAEPKLKLLAITQASNVLGSYYDLKPILAEARARKIITVVDSAQSIVHQPLKVKDLACDFLAFGSHKLFGPSGVGVLYGRSELLTTMPTFLVGGGMIDEVTRDSFTTAEAPDKFEAGTPNIEGAIGLGEACRYLTQITWPVITKRESELSKYFTQALAPLDFVKLLGTSTNRLPLFAMSFTDMHPHDVADLLGERGIITRAGQHCAAPLHDQLKLRATLRASLAFYNTEAEIDTFIIALKEIHQLLNS